MKRILGFLMIVMIAVAASADMVTNSITYTTTWVTNNPSPLFQVYLQQLDTNIGSFGSVLSIEVGTYGTNTFDVTIENDNVSAQTFDVEASGNTFATNPGPVAVVAPHSGTLASTNLAASTPPSGSGPDFAAFDDLVSTAFDNAVVTSGFNSLYFGAGTFPVDVAAKAFSSVVGPGDYTFVVSDNRSLGLVYVKYTYTLIPEPGVWTGLAAVAGLALAVRFRRRQRRS